jgi:predicted anti-sigma-YlaC factor YlaD
MRLLIVLSILVAVCAGCSFKRVAVNKLGDALAAGGTTFASDDDPELIRDATPFSLKLMESLLAESPNHRGLLLASCKGFTQYSYAFVQCEADELEANDLAKSTALRKRAQRLYLRARNYGLRGLEVNHPMIERALRSDAKTAALKLRPRDVALMYWTATAWGAAIALSKDTPEIVADLPIVEALMDRALMLDENFDDGAIHVFLISYEMARPGGKAAAESRARKHFDRAVELTHGQLASPFVTFAEQVCVAKQNKAEFQAVLERAIAINVDARPEWRLVNLVMQRRARWLQSRTSELFLD